MYNWCYVHAYKLSGHIPLYIYIYMYDEYEVTRARRARTAGLPCFPSDTFLCTDDNIPSKSTMLTNQQNHLNTRRGPQLC